MAREYKTTIALGTKASDQGIVETVFAVMGNVDEGGDIIHPGAFSKTFAERGLRVKVLDHHRRDSIMNVIAKPLELRELQRDQLPGDVLAKCPDATGGAYAKVQFLLNTPEGAGAFERIKSGAVDEWSFGYDALDADYGRTMKNGAEVTVRNLRSIRLHELSPVLWGMNPATATVSAKGEETKPAPEAGESRDDYLSRCIPQVLDEGTATDNDQAVAICSSMFERAGKAAEEGHMAEPETDTERKAGRVIAKRNAERLARALAELNDVLKDAKLLDVPDEDEDDDEEEQPAPAKQAAVEVDSVTAGAGPVAPPTHKRRAVVETLRMQQQQLEVTP